MANLHVGLDLGGDTLKIAFACEHNGVIRYGKIINPSRLTQIAIPALAYYDAYNQKWLYGDQIEKKGESFVTVVKIKSLLSLLSYNESRQTLLRNKNYFYNGNSFPKFYFPARRKMLDNFDSMIRQDRTFMVRGDTPQTVCQAFFNYVKSLVDYRVSILEKLYKTTFSGYQIAIVHPSSVGDDYVTELSSLVKNSFGVEAGKVLSANKALSMYAYQRGMVKNNEDFLVFDMGEEEISVVRAGVSNKNIIIDGVEGHNEPLEIGGIDVDEAIVNYLERSISNRETIGTPHAGDNGHIFEDSIYGKQYLLMKDIKKAKVLFSREEGRNFFEGGIPITVCRDIFIQRSISKSDLKNCIGVTGETGVAKKIADYILSELSQPVNHDIKKVFLSGGLTETYSLLDFIKYEVAKDYPSVKIYTFDDDKNSGSDFDILSFEDSVFAPSVGGAIVSLKNIDIKTVTSLSYATWVYDSQTRQKVLSIFVDRGTEIKEGVNFTTTIYLRNYGVKDNEEMYSTFVTRDDLVKKRFSSTWSFTSGGDLIVGEPDSAERRKAMKDIGLNVVTGGKNGKIYFKYDGVSVKLEQGSELVAEEGVQVDKNGRATPIIKNISGKFDYVLISPYNTTYNTRKVRALDVDICTEGLDVISITND